MQKPTPRRKLSLLFPVCLVCVFAGSVRAQNFHGIQFHGFANQAFLYSSDNNYLTMQSNSGSWRWTDGAISATDSLTDSFRLGAQIHMYQLGELGGANLQLDWATGDYKVNDSFGFRAGKVKTVEGLFNDSQEVDASFLWILLPQSTYPVDNQSFTLSHLGGDVYGYIPLGKRSGTLHYTAYIGYNSLDENGGYVKQLADDGLAFKEPPGGKTYGRDVRWAAAMRGLTAGCSAIVMGLDGSAPAGIPQVPSFLVNTEYAQFTKGKFYLAGEFRSTPPAKALTLELKTFPVPDDYRAWYAMGSYRLASKLHVGTYYSHYLNKSISTPTPAKYSKDWVLSARYDFNPYFYGKIESHFLHGTGLGYYGTDNPNGLKPNSDILAAKIGFSF